MTRHVINDGATTYRRITKREARKLFDKGETFYIIAHKMRPGFPFSMGMTIDPAKYHEDNAQTAKFDAEWKAKYPDTTHVASLHTFDSVIRDFCYYNANCNETGYYPSFYLTSERTR